MGATYDLFGNGRTALKVDAEQVPRRHGNDRSRGVPNVSDLPESDQPVEHQTTRPWIDNGANGGIANDFIPQCNLQDYAANGECGALVNAGIFGTILTAAPPTIPT